METNNDCNICDNIEAPILVVEMVGTLNFDGHWFLHRHQYPFVRSEMKEANPEYPNINNNPYYLYNIVYLEKEKVEVAIPAHIGILTDKLLTELEQDTLLYLREKYQDKVKNRLEEYKRSLPIGETDETFGHAIHKHGNIKEILGIDS